MTIKHFLISHYIVLLQFPIITDSLTYSDQNTLYYIYVSTGSTIYTCNIAKCLELHSLKLASTAKLRQHHYWGSVIIHNCQMAQNDIEWLAWFNY